MSEARVVLSTCPDARTAEALARALVDERLAACVNLVPGVRSIYRWQGEVEEAEEFLLLVKTTAANVALVTARIEELHTYEVPEVVVIRADGGSARYLEWIAGQVRVP